MCGEIYKPTGNRQKYCLTCRKIKQAEFEATWLNQYRQEHKAQSKAYAASYYPKNKERIQRQTKQRADKLKAEVLTHYGNGNLACVDCGFSHIRALTIDHTDGGGGKHRRTLGNRGSGHRFYFDLKKQGYPKGYQTLCINCQWIKQAEQREWGSGRPACNKALGGK